MVTGIREEAIFVRRDKQLASCLHAGDDQATTFFSPALLWGCRISAVKETGSQAP